MEIKYWEKENWNYSEVSLIQSYFSIKINGCYFNCDFNVYVKK